MRPYFAFSVVTVLGMQSLRVILPLFQQYLRDSVGISSLNLAPIALGVFALAFLPGLLVRRAGLKGALGFTMTAIPLLRLFEQLSRSSAMDLVLSGAAVVLFWWFLAVAYTLLVSTPNQKPIFATGLLAGLAFDTALHAGAGTLDFSWQTGLLPAGIVLVLAGAVFLAGPGWRRDLDADIPTAQGLQVPGRQAAFGVWLLLQMMVFQNVARFASLSGWSLPLSGLAVTAGSILAVLASGYKPPFGRHTAWSAGLLLAGLLALPPLAGLVGFVWLVAGQLLMANWLVAVVLSAPAPGKRSLFAGTFGPAALLYVVCAFLYYVSYDLSLGLRAFQLLPVYGALLFLSGAASLRGKWEVQSRPFTARSAAAILLLLLLPAVYLLRWNTAVPLEPGETNRQVRIMSYNLHQAFNTDGQLSIEALAQQIEASGADIVALQEVARGYLTTGSFDMLGWLSHRLGMPYVSGPASDPQWGNALLSRFPITASENHPLPPADLLLMRGYILASVDFGAGELTVIATHLHHRGPDGFIREEQVPVLLDAWGGASNAVILGDLNAVPESPEMQRIAGAGLLSASELSGGVTFTFPSTGPDREIDYIWYTPDMVGSDFEIYQNTASDHLPIAVTLELP